VSALLRWILVLRQGFDALQLCDGDIAALVLEELAVFYRVLDLAGQIV
jgi:hypothetical protein